MPATAAATRQLPEHEERDVLQLLVRVDQRLLRTSRCSNTQTRFMIVKQGASKAFRGRRMVWGIGGGV